MTSLPCITCQDLTLADDSGSRQSTLIQFQHARIGMAMHDCPVQARSEMSGAGRSSRFHRPLLGEHVMVSVM
jgi:hypothetical protein